MYVCVYLVHWLYFILLLGHGCCTAEKRRRKKWYFGQELGSTKDGVNCSRRSFPVKRCMDKYMWLMIQVEKETRTCRLQGHRFNVKRDVGAGMSLLYVLDTFYIMEQRVLYLIRYL